MSLQDYLGIGGILVPLLVGIVSWFISAHLTKKTIEKKKISYEIKLFPIIADNLQNRASDLQIYFKGKLLNEPTFLSIDIINSGNVAIEHPPIEIQVPGANHIVPGYLENVPAGYNNLWSMGETSGNSCTIHLEHINPGQIVKARFFLDKSPDEPIDFICPMMDLEVKEIKTDVKDNLIKALEYTAPISNTGYLFYRLLTLKRK